MPDDQGKLSEDDRATVNQWLESRWKDARCHVCRENSWTIGGHTVAPLRTTPQGGVGIGGVLYPQVMVICTNCGNTVYFNAALMKLVESKSDIDAKSETEGEESDGDD